jgi:hypothetical protein
MNNYLQGIDLYKNSTIDVPNMKVLLIHLNSEGINNK